MRLRTFSSKWQSFPLYLHLWNSLLCKNLLLCETLFKKKIHDGPEIFLKTHAGQLFWLSSFFSPFLEVLLLFLRQDLILKVHYSCNLDWIAYLSSALPSPMHFAHIKKLPFLWSFSFLRSWLMHIWSLTICRLTVRVFLWIILSCVLDI